MKTPSNVVPFVTLAKAESFYPGSIPKGKISQLNGKGKIAKTPANKGLKAKSSNPVGVTEGDASDPKGKSKILASGPMKCVSDIASMTPTQLHLAYPREYSSWSHAKARCKNKKGWCFDPAWNDFKDFLEDMGPKPDPSYTLDRIDNALRKYGPKLCRWASSAVQNNNKGDNVKFTMLGEDWTVAKLAKEHKRSENTIRNRIASKWTRLELVLGRKHVHLAMLSPQLEALAAKAKMPPAQLSLIPDPPMELWEPDEDDHATYLDTGVPTCHVFTECYNEIQAINAWIELYNAGLPHSPEPPQGKHYRPTLAKLLERFPAPKGMHASVASSFTLPDYPCCDSDDEPGPKKHKDDFDPTDCADPEECDDGSAPVYYE